jgi:hypothetical protein
MRIKDIIIDTLTLVALVGTIYGLGLIAWAVQ